ncbi:pentapeptide repeat-containing protein [Gelidibacter mesophilus]|uniref:pentapeptide repeat-containing protein n=1 Tax=Gelidibacter mesophilus TaxID=169050 RepID=UPI00042136EA|nr:pentapeptide repeat-containing protein [Gelidibacter mesophilus]
MNKSKLSTTILICVGLLILILIFGKVLGSNWQYLTQWLYPNETDKNAKTLQLIFSIAGGIVIIAGLYISYKRVASTEESVRIQQKTLIGQNKIIENQTTEIELSRKSQINEQFKIAVEHLGNNNQAVVIGGFIELVFIAEEDPEKYAEIVHKLFCSFLRAEASKEKEIVNIDYYLVDNIISFLFDSNVFDNKISDLSNLNFRDCKFENKNFNNVNFSGCFMPLKIINSSFENCSFNHTKFINPNVKLRFIKAFEKESKEADKMGLIKNTTFKNCTGHPIYFYFYELRDVRFIECENLYINSFSNCFLHKITGSVIYPGSKHFFSEFISVEFPKEAKHISFFCCDFQSIDISKSKMERCEISYCKFFNIITELNQNTLEFKNNRIIELRSEPKTYYRISFVPVREFLNISNEFSIEEHDFFKFSSGKIYVGNTSEEYINQIINGYNSLLKELGIEIVK